MAQSKPLKKKPVKPVRWTFHLHTGKPVTTRPTYNPNMNGYVSDSNWVGKRSWSCCGVFEVGNICIFGDLRGASTWTWEKKLTAFKNFLDDVKRNHGMIVMYLLPAQWNNDIGRLVRATEFKTESYWNPKTGNILRLCTKILHSSAPAPKPRKNVSAFNMIMDF